ncbi:MAG: hypothetical protein Q9165_003224 [Trypethelium subeluteriae]
MTNFNIEIVSDVNCPWCYVGKKRLEKAIAAYRASSPSSTSTDTFTTRWHPFYLNPDAPSPGIDKQAYYAAKFGPQRLHAMFSRLGAIGAQEGIAFKFGGRTGNTRDAHRLIQLGWQKGGQRLQTSVVAQLFALYFENEGDLTDPAQLVAAAGRAGLDEGEAREWLEGEGGGEVVDREVEDAARRRIHGVPHFTIQGEFEVEGAEGPEVFVEIFERIKGRGGESNGEVRKGETC